MTLQGIRQKLVELTGRFDLVVSTTTWADNGADFFIREGQRYLDRLVDTPKSKLDLAVPILAGESLARVGKLRTIEYATWASVNGSNSRRLDIAPRDVLYAYFGVEGSLEHLARGLPTHLALVPVRSAEGPTEETETLLGVRILVPPDTDGILTLHGLALSAELKENEDVSFWTLAEPLLLVQAAMLMMEEVWRNTQGTNDIANAIRRKIVLLESDSIVQEGAGIYQMQNSW